MSVVEDVRKVVQDMVTPELRALSARLDAVEKQLDRIDKRFDDVEGRAEQRHQETLRHVDQRIDDLGFLLRNAMEVKDLSDRVAALEGRTKQPAQ
jgi:hypothetical protein